MAQQQEQRAALRLYQEWEEESPNKFRSSAGLVHVCHVDTCNFYYVLDNNNNGQRICAISGRVLEQHASKRSRNMT